MVIHQVIDFEGVTPEELFRIYLDADRHAAAINAPVTISRTPNTPFSAFGPDKVRGTTLHVVENELVVQSWRGTVWKPSDPDSIASFGFSATPDGARIVLLQAGVPAAAFDTIDRGWHSMYWLPWRTHLRRHDL